MTAIMKSNDWAFVPPSPAPIENSSPNPNIIYIEKSDVGATLSTWYYCCLWQLYTAEKMGCIGYINWPPRPDRSLRPHWDPAAFSRCPNMYEWYCEQPVWQGPPPPRNRVMLWEDSAYSAAMNEHSLMAQPLEVIRQWFKKHLRFNAAVKARAEAIAAKYAIDFPSTLAVSWRGCDSTDDGRPRLPISVYYPFIDDILKDNPHLRIFVTAEEVGVAEELQQRYPQAFTINEFFSAPAGYRQHSEYVNPASGYERGMQTCCLITILSKCAFYVKNRSSMAGVASWLSDGHIVNLAHPENLSHGFDITKAEIKGQLVPLYR